MRILSALTDWALEGSIVTADSMRARGYGSTRRTSFQIYRFTSRDVVLIGLMAMLLLGTLAYGGTSASYTPELLIDRPTWGLACYAAFLLIPIVLHGIEEIQRKLSLSRL